MKPLLALLSCVLCTLFLFTALNYYLYVSGKAREPEHILWTLEQTTYSPRYLYWSKDPQLTGLPVVFRPKIETSDAIQCKKIMFLGDSFTVAPWMGTTESYASRVSQGYADHVGSCVEQRRLAAGGASNDQEFALFVDYVDRLQPNIVFWQFYWNDAYENIIQALYAIKNGRLEKRMAWLNTMFIAGYLNQNIPFFRYTTLGKHLLYLGETADFFGYWDITTLEDVSAILVYNRKKIRLMLRAMEELSKAKGFELYVTMAPLECQMVVGQECPTWLEDVQKGLHDLLVGYPYYISMEYPHDIGDVLGVTSVPTWAALFGSEEKELPVGYRHLTREGNRYYGGVLLGNFLTK